VNFVKKEYGVTPEKISLGKDKPLGLENPFTGEQMSRSDVMVIPRESIGGTYYDIGSYNKETNELENFGMTGYRTKEEAEAYIEHLFTTPKSVKEVWRIPVTDEIKRKVLLEGQYFSKKKPEDEFSRPYDIG
jgi:hypothetical protein